MPSPRISEKTRTEESESERTWQRFTNRSGSVKKLTYHAQQVGLQHEHLQELLQGPDAVMSLWFTMS
jgi:Cu/Ag efflux protein CusF